MENKKSTLPFCSHQTQHLVIHSFSYHFLSTYYVPGIILGAGDPNVEDTTSDIKISQFWEEAQQY